MTTIVVCDNHLFFDDQLSLEPIGFSAEATNQSKVFRLSNNSAIIGCAGPIVGGLVYHELWDVFYTLASGLITSAQRKEIKQRFKEQFPFDEASASFLVVCPKYHYQIEIDSYPSEDTSVKIAGPRRNDFKSPTVIGSGRGGVITSFNHAENIQEALSMTGNYDPYTSINFKSVNLAEAFKPETTISEEGAC